MIVIRRIVLYLFISHFCMPLNRVFVTNEHAKYFLRISLFTKLLVCVFTIFLSSCAATRWHAIEEIPAEATAYLRDGVFVSGDYIRHATISEIDGKPVDRKNKDLIEISLGVHEVKILCDETRGKFNSNDLLGQSKTLTLDAKIQRTYIIRCLPYTHWWIEDSENNSIVAGEKPAKI